MFQNKIERQSNLLHRLGLILLPGNAGIGRGSLKQYDLSYLGADLIGIMIRYYVNLDKKKN